MKCGHAYHPTALYGLMKSYVFSDLGHEVKCCAVTNLADKSTKAGKLGEGCQAVWDISVLIEAALLSPAERKAFELEMSINYSKLKSKEKIIICKECKFSIELEGTFTTKRVSCLGCRYVEKKQNYDICLNCHQRWISVKYLTSCGNVACESNIDKMADLLQTAPMVQKNGADVPQFRACPRKHTDGLPKMCELDTGCKHMPCVGCKKEFCFRCLSLKSDTGSWSCGSSSTVCDLAPKQTKQDLLKLCGS